MLKIPDIETRGCSLIRGTDYYDMRTQTACTLFPSGYGVFLSSRPIELRIPTARSPSHRSSWRMELPTSFGQSTSSYFSICASSRFGFPSFLLIILHLEQPSRILRSLGCVHPLTSRNRQVGVSGFLSLPVAILPAYWCLHRLRAAMREKHSLFTQLSDFKLESVEYLA